MRLLTRGIPLITALVSSISFCQPTELDQYLQSKNILNAQYKIQDKKALNEILKSLTEEDARVLPYQLDQNIILEKIELYANHVDVEGMISTPDFKQFVDSMGEKQFKAMMRRNLIQNCPQLFEHQFQHANPYYIDLKLSATHQQYRFKLKNTECSKP